MEDRRDGQRLGKEYRGIEMNSETTMIMESIQTSENRITKQPFFPLQSLHTIRNFPPPLRTRFSSKWKAP